MGTKRTSLGPKYARRLFEAAAASSTAGTSNSPSYSDADGSPPPPSRAAEQGPIFDDDEPKEPVDLSDSRVPFVPKINGSASAVREFPTGCGIDSKNGIVGKPPVTAVGNAGGSGSGSSSRIEVIDVENWSRSNAGKKTHVFQEKGENLKQKLVGSDSAGFDRERVMMAMYRERIVAMASILQGPGQRVAAPVLKKERQVEVESLRDLEPRLIVLGLMSARTCPWANKTKIARNRTASIPKPR